MEKYLGGGDPDSVELSRSKEGAQVIETTGMVVPDPPSGALDPVTIDSPSEGGGD